MCRASREGGTFRYGVPGGRPERLAVGEEERRAQSRGLWLGVRRTFFRGLDGMALWVGGGARELVAEEVGERFGSGEGRADGGGMRDVVGVAFRRGGPRARCAEFADGKEGGGIALCAEFAAGKDGGGMFEARCAEFAAGNDGGGILVAFDARCAEFAAGKEEGGVVLPSVRVKDGTVVESEEGVAREDGFLKVGGGGGGMAFLSNSSFLGRLTVSSASSFVIVGISF